MNKLICGGEKISGSGIFSLPQNHLNYVIFKYYCILSYPVIPIFIHHCILNLFINQLSRSGSNLVFNTEFFTDYSDCAPKTAAPQGLDDEAAKKLWDLSASMVGLT